jgi:hypothetical protein
LRPLRFAIDNLIHPLAFNKQHGNVCCIPLQRNTKARFQAEVLVFLSAVQAATQLLEQAFRVLGRLRKAHARQKALVDVLAHHEGELASVKAIIGIIDDEEDLRTASVTSELIRLKVVQSKLVKLLEELDPKPRGPAQQFVRQLTKGSSDEGRLSSIMTELGQVKSMLLLRIQVANVGVMHNMEKRLVANTEVIERIDQFLREEIGGCKGLRIARLLKGRLPSSKWSKWRVYQMC